jgi:hypothetical protein
MNTAAAHPILTHEPSEVGQASRLSGEAGDEIDGLGRKCSSCETGETPVPIVIENLK